MPKLVIFLCFMFPIWLFSQTLVINELDCDTPGIDDKEFLELKSQVPNYPLDGYVVVFFNGSASGGNTSYLFLNLDGYKTDINGIFLIGSTTVVPIPQYIIPQNVIQNGEDAVAIYKTKPERFFESTLAFVDETLIDVLIYGTNDPDAQGLIEIYKAFNPTIKQINEGSANNTNSIQRNNDATYFTGSPTPRRPNDGGGIILNGLLSTFSKKEYNEGDTVSIIFTTEQIIEEDLFISFSLDNGTFNSTDYVGQTSITMSKGTNTASTSFIIIDDSLDEGDEEMLFLVADLPEEFLILNNNVKIRIVDNDFRVADFGTPIKPTYDKIQGTQPSDYYEKLNGKSGTLLRQSIQDIIANQSKVRAQTYADVINILTEADQNPENSNQVWLVYLEKGRAKLDLQTSSNNTNVWNREHTWPRSRGGFDSIEEDEIADGKNIFWITNADSLRHANSDAHAIRVADGLENSSRGNNFYGEYNGPLGTLGGFKGDVARGIFYLDIRYNALELVNGFPFDQQGKFGDLATLLEWHRNDPPDDFERNRNNVVYEWQNNRNPFIDHPEMVEYLWGNKLGQSWQPTSSINPDNEQQIKLFPNPTKNIIQIEGVNGSCSVEFFDSQSRLILSRIINEEKILSFEIPSGVYIVKIKGEKGVFTQKIIVE